MTETAETPPVSHRAGLSSDQVKWVEAAWAAVDAAVTTSDSTGKVVPRLATSWSNSSDAKTWDFIIRVGVSFRMAPRWQ